jgi:UDP-3-O-[3-hydroxymyristoyl] glucosamine N-acyltransferase
MPTLTDIAKLINATLIGNTEQEISGIATLKAADKNQLTYIVSDKYKSALIESKAGCVILTKNLLDACPTNALVVDDAYLAFAKISHLFKPQIFHQPGTHSSAEINNAKIGANCCIGKNVILGKNTIIGANTVIEDNTTIGEHCNIGANITLLQKTQIGHHVIIEAGCVIGSEGFGNARDADKKWQSIAHLGNVIIGNHVSIGANTVIDRGTLDDTQICDGVRLDNLIHIAHNVIIGEDSAIAACVGIAGSANIGKRCMVGGMVGIMGHVKICDDVIINAKSAVDKHIKKPGIYTGIVPLMTHKKWQVVGVWLTKLDKIAKHLNIKLKHLKEY